MAHALIASVADVNLPAANVAAIVTRAASASRKQRVYQLLWSYSAAPTGGRVRVQLGTLLVRDVDITAAGPGSVRFEPPLDSADNEEMAVTLSAGGAGITGKLNVDSELLDDV